MCNATHESVVLHSEPLSSPMQGIDPFIFGAYHQDHYPQGNANLGPDPSLLKGRNIGMDFSGRDGFSMYHGDLVPGFPAHPHRGFETVTIVRKGLVDHADSLGAAARYGEGDVQWLTTGAGVQHGEMFPLIHQDKDNTLDLFQIWLNLPPEGKMSAPNFTIFWGQTIPHVEETDANGITANIEIIAGDYHSVKNPSDVTKALAPPKDSWASHPTSDVAIWIIRLPAQGSLTLPRATPEARRALYLSTGNGLAIGDEKFHERMFIEVKSEEPTPLKNITDTTIEILVLQGRPIAAPVVARGPFVMNTQAELNDALNDFRRTEFGGWPWPSRAQTHGDQPRFAKYPDGRVEHPSN